MNPIRGRTRLLTAACLVTAALALGTASAQAPQEKLLLSVAVPTVAAYDTMYNVRAITYDRNRLPDRTAHIQWAVHPSPTALAVLPTDSVAQHVNLAAKVEGVAYVVATWQRGTTVVYRDSIRVLVKRPRVVAAYTFTDVRNGQLVRADTIAVGEKRCAYTVVFNRHDEIMSGLPSPTHSSNPSVFAREGPGPLCPDTTVNPSLVHPLNHRAS